MIGADPMPKDIEFVSISRLVIKLGGSSLFDSHDNIRLHQITQLGELLLRFKKKNIQCFVIIGGGNPTRKLVNHLSRTDINKAQLDQISILQTRVHAKIVQSLLQNDFEVVFLESFQNFTNYNYHSDQTIITAGQYPGQSTNGVAAVIAETVNADLIINYFNYDKISTIDPETEQEGEFLDVIDYNELEKLIDHFKQEPGHYELFDKQALNIIQRSSIPIVFLNGKNIGLAQNILDGHQVGTLVTQVEVS